MKKSQPVEASRVVEASPATVWRIVSDLEGYASVAPGLAHIETRGDGEGMWRRCTDEAGRSWEETCVLWDEGRAYSFSVDTSTYPPPLRRLLKTFQGTWIVDPHPRGSIVTMRFEGEVGMGVVGRLIARVMRRKGVRDMEAILERWELMALARERDAAAACS